MGNKFFNPLVVVLLLALGVVAGMLLNERMSNKVADSANPMEQAEAAYRQQDYATVLSIVEPLANAGDSLAQYRLGLMHATGLGTAIDLTQATTWLERASAQNEAGAKELLATVYFDRAKQAEISEAQRLSLLQSSAELGNSQAQRMLGSYYIDGFSDIEADIEKALLLLGRAAEQGDALAMSNLGYIYSSGKHLQRDYARAFVWYKNAAEAGVVRAQTALALLYERGNGVAINLPEAVRWYLSAAVAGDERAEIRLGELIASAKVTLESGAEATKAVAKAAANGNSEALGWLEQRANNGDLLAMSLLADYLLQQPDKLESGLALLQRAASQGSHRAQLALATRYATGSDVPQDYVQAHLWANLAAASGAAEAIKTREAFAQLMTPEQLAQAQEQARHWQPAQRQ